MKRALISTFLFLAACGGGGNEGDGGGGATDFSDPVDASIAIGQAMCESAHRCREQYPAEMAAFIPFEALFGTSVSQCEGQLAQSDPDLAPAVDAGRTVYHQDQAEACVDALDTTACDQYWTTDNPSCDQVLEGTLSDGATCSDDFECVSDDCDTTCQPAI